MLLKDKKEIETIKKSNIYECMSKTQNKINELIYCIENNLNIDILQELKNLIKISGGLR